MGDDSTLVGRLLADKYLLIERLGEGGFGSIWRAEHQVLRSPIAVKLIDLEVARREGAVERFLREAQATAVLRSPHVVQVLDYGLDKRVENGVDCEQPFIVMELLEGENLADRIARVGPLPPLEVARVVTHVARAISRAHELGIVHRDLKPENIFLVNNGDAEVAKVLDFGVAKIATPMDLNRNTYTQTGSMVGTVYYMSPEQAQGNKSVDFRSDLWALGVITFEMLTGRRPFDSDALGDLVLSICMRDLPVPSQYGTVPQGFDAWFTRAVARDPEQRFQSARELALALLELVENQDGGVRFTQFDELPSLKPPNVKPIDPGFVVEIPSRPGNNAFAATVRDDTLALSLVDSSPRPVTAHEERLTPWALAGMAVLALAAGAAAVYGLFHLLGDPNSEDATSISSPTAFRENTRPLKSIPRTKRKGDVAASNQPNSASSAAKRRSGTDASQSPQSPSEALQALPTANNIPESPTSTSKAPLPVPSNATSARVTPENGAEAPPTFQTEPPAGTTLAPSPTQALDAHPSNETSSALPVPKADGESTEEPLIHPIDRLPMVTD